MNELYVARKNRETGKVEYKLGKFSMRHWVDEDQKDKCWKFKNSCCAETLTNVINSGSSEYEYYFVLAD